MARADAVRPSFLRPDVRLEDALSDDALAVIGLKLDEAEANATTREADSSAWEDALSPEELRELAARAGQGERVSLNSAEA